MELGRLCVKIAGRDAGRISVVVDQIDHNFVLIDGNVRRRKTNIRHLEPLDKVLKLKKGASHTEVAEEFKKLQIPVWHTKPKASKKQKEEVKTEPKKAEKPKKEAPKAKKVEKK